jgi:peptide/nickel transport system permease protein
MIRAYVEKLARRSSSYQPRRRVALRAGLIVVAGFYLLAICADFLAPYDYRAQARHAPLAPPTALRLRDAQGQWRARPFVYASRLIDPLTRRYEEDAQQAYSLEFFAPGYSYQLFGLFSANRHLFGLRAANDVAAPRVHLLGTDALGRDRWSRLLAATRFSLLIGPLSTLLASALGILLGCLAGYAGRWTDAVLMRIADALMALPNLVLILAARAAFPLALPPLRAGLLLITIFVVLGWAEMARLARGLVLELRTRDFVLAATSIGLPPAGILWRHILPNAARPLMAQALLMLPAFLLAETALSFLGVGLQEPEPSWGNMLTAAADISLLESGQALLLLTPAFAIALFVLGVRLISRGLEATDQDNSR